MSDETITLEAIEVPEHLAHAIESVFDQKDTRVAELADTERSTMEKLCLIHQDDNFAQLEAARRESVNLKTKAEQLSSLRD